MKLSQKQIFITGAGSGIGAALAVACAQEGARVILSGRSLSKLQAVYDYIVELKGPTPLLAPLDLYTAGPPEMAQLLQALSGYLREEELSLDACIHNAAFLGSRTPLLHYPADLWLRAMQINCNTPFLLTQTLLPLLAQSPQGRILFNIGGLPQSPTAYWGAFGASKAALDHWAQILAAEYRDHPTLKIYRFDPGPVRSALRATAFPAEPSAELACPADIVGPIVDLLCQSSHAPSQGLLSIQEQPKNWPVF